MDSINIIKLNKLRNRNSKNHTILDLLFLNINNKFSLSYYEFNCFRTALKQSIYICKKMPMLNKHFERLINMKRINCLYVDSSFLFTLL